MTSGQETLFENVNTVNKVDEFDELTGYESTTAEDFVDAETVYDKEFIIENEEVENHLVVTNEAAAIQNIDIKNVKKQIDWLKDFQDLLFKELKPESDFEEIQGSYMLTKAGSSKTQYITNSLCMFEYVSKVEDYGKGLFSYTVEAKLVDKKNNSLVLGTGRGSDSSFDPSTYYKWVDESKLPLYYKQDIDFDKYITPLMENSVNLNDKKVILSEVTDWSEERKQRFMRRLNKKLVDHIANTELELDDLEIKDDDKGNKLYKIPKSPAELASLKHKILEMASKRAEAFACRRAFNIDEVLKKIASEHKKKIAEGKPEDLEKLTVKRKGQQVPLGDLDKNSLKWYSDNYSNQTIKTAAKKLYKAKYETL